MEKEKLTVNDEELIELAYSTTYRSSIRTMIQEADTERWHHTKWILKSRKRKIKVK